MLEVIDECYGCVHDEPIIENALQYCSHCKRGTSDKKQRYYREDLYVNRHEKEKKDV